MDGTTRPGAPLEFASDNTGPVHPEVLAALAAANDGYAGGYGADRWTEGVVDRIRAILDAPEAVVHLVATGTAANSLALATLTKPWQTVFCSEMAHIHEDECNAPEFYTGGAKLTPLPAPDAKITPEALRAAMLREETRGVHGAAAGAGLDHPGDREGHGLHGGRGDGRGLRRPRVRPEGPHGRRPLRQRAGRDRTPRPPT